MRAPPVMLLLLAAVPAALVAAPREPVAGDTRERISSLVVYGNDPCPRSSGDDIVVCARLPEAERYRVPKRFRNKRRTDPAATAWGARVQALEYVGRDGRPNSCSPVGSNGQTGCQQQFLSQWRAERDAVRSDAAAIP